MRMNGVLRGLVGVALVPMLLVQQSAAWGRDGHKMINRLAAAALPSDVPEFLRSPAALDAMEYYGPEPDNWKSNTEMELKQSGEPDHFMDMEWADAIGGPLPRRRYDFIRALAVAQKAHPAMTLTPEGVGLLPYAADEGYERLKAVMRDYRGMPEGSKDRKALEQEMVFLAGILGHWVADGSQPLHATYQYNGWTGENPNGYTTEHKIHSQFEAEFVKANLSASKDVAALMGKPMVIDDVFEQYVGYLRKSNAMVEKVYQFEKAGELKGSGSPESRAFLEERLAAGATELRDIIYTAWVRSADPLPPYRNGVKTVTPPAGM